MGSGTLTLSINGVSTDIEIASGQDSLEEVAAAINASRPMPVPLSLTMAVGIESQSPPAKLD